MVLVTGVTGSGKSSTMAALVNAINASYEKHILTLENPIEFIHTDIKSSVTQREVGLDTDSFRMGLRAALSFAASHRRGRGDPHFGAHRSAPGPALDLCSLRPSVTKPAPKRS